MNKKKIGIIVSIGAVLIFCIVYSVNWMFFDIQRIKAGEYLNQYTSPEQTYTVSIYLNNGGATVDYAVLGVLKNCKTGKEKNIYWQNHCENAIVTWLDDKTIVINGIELDVEKDIYDYRNKK